jgi:cyclophilin family peptidyl-prolyl cis-trans isomerase/HEAT repeat protein
MGFRVQSNRGSRAVANTGKCRHAARRRVWAGSVTGVLVLFAALPEGAVVAQQAKRAPTGNTPPSRSALLERMLRAEDARGSGPDSLRPQFQGLANADSTIRRLAVRGLGRQERRELVPMIVPLLRDSAATVRAEAVNAIAQAVRGPVGEEAGSQIGKVLSIDSVLLALRMDALEEESPEVLGVLARSLGRLPYSAPARARDAEEAINGIVGRATDTTQASGRRHVPVTVLFGAAHGLYDLARARRSLGDLSGPSIAVLRSAATYFDDSGSTRSGDMPSDAAVRRLGWLGLTAAGHRNDLLARGAAHDPDPQVRRLAVLYAPNVTDTAFQRDLLRSARNDASFLVRIEWVRLYRQLFAATDCRPLLDLIATDPSPAVRIAGIDALGAACPRLPDVRAWLRGVLDSASASALVRRAGQASWHARAHAVVSLARLDSGAAIPEVRKEALRSEWQVRQYAARAAAIARDATTLERLAVNAESNVREAAIEGLATVRAHSADTVYLSALRSPDYQVVLAAARALKGATRSRAEELLLIDALDRLTLARRENSRDSRMELVARIGESGDSTQVRRLLPYLQDFDPMVAARVAAILARWTGRSFQIKPARVTASDTGLARLALGSVVRLRITMSPASGGGMFVLRLDASEAPATVARVLRLAGRHYYDGLTWHRVVPNFVIQGGSPGANEYVGDGPFMRDELGLPSHLRGTVGISTRGRDTGDAQLFVNLVDNFRLDHDYTVFGHVESGMDIVDGILEGDVIARVERIP